MINVAAISPMRPHGLFDIGAASSLPNLERYLSSTSRMPKSDAHLRVAVLDDDPIHLDLVTRTMRSIGYCCHDFRDASELLRALRRETFDLLILDWQMPGLTGLDVVLWVREHQVQWVPIIFLSNRGDERDVVKGFECGVDDYMVKPVRVAELTARARAQLRRGNASKKAQAQVYSGYRFDANLRVVQFDGRTVELKDKEFMLAHCLFANLGRLMSRQHLVEAVWGFGASNSTRVLDSLLSILRKKLYLRPENGFRLSAVYGVGYRLEELEGPRGLERFGESDVDASKGLATSRLHRIV